MELRLQRRMPRLREGTSVAARTTDKIDGDYRTAFSSDAGKRVLRHLMNNNFIWVPTSDPDPQVSASNEGKRIVVLNILDRIRYKPDSVAFMEAYNEAGMDYDYESSKP